MKYKGKIKHIDKIIISDPIYTEEVKCRYERTNVDAKNWKININIDNVQTNEIKGIEFFVLMQAEDENCILKNDGSFLYYAENEIEEIRIGMDSASIAIGINKAVDEIKESVEDWQPECALETLTDGEFGCVKEGKKEGKICFIYFNGYLDEDTEYTIEEIIKYLIEQLEIEGLEEMIKSNQIELGKSDLEI